MSTWLLVNYNRAFVHFELCCCIITELMFIPFFCSWLTMQWKSPNSSTRWDGTYIKFSYRRKGLRHLQISLDHLSQSRTNHPTGSDRLCRKLTNVQLGQLSICLRLYPGEGAGDQPHYLWRAQPRGGAVYVQDKLGGDSFVAEEQERKWTIYD